MNLIQILGVFILSLVFVAMFNSLTIGIGGGRAVYNSKFTELLDTMFAGILSPIWITLGIWLIV